MSYINKTSSFNKLIAFIPSFISLLVIIFYSKINHFFKNFCEKYLLKDGAIEKGREFVLDITLLFFISIGFFISIILYFELHRKLGRYLNTFIDTDKLKTSFFNDTLTSKSKFAKKMFLTSTLFAIIWHLKYLLFGETPELEFYKEPILEQIFSTLFFVSSILLIIAVFYLKKNTLSKINKKFLQVWLIISSLILLLIFLEEISWGQQYFGWESTGVFKANNSQNETNLHNFFNPFFNFIYPAIGMSFIAIMLLVWFYSKAANPYWFRLITPHQSLIVLTLFISGASFYGENETFEEFLAFFVFLYSIRVFYCLKYPNPIELKKD